MPPLCPADEVRALCRDPAVCALVAAAEGRAVHLVGGVLRDRFLGQATADLDAVVAGDAAAVAERLAALTSARLIRLGGERFAAYRLTAHGWLIDLWGRGETSLEQDLERRDLTINALALEAESGELVDPFHGLADLAAGRLRATGVSSFAGDPLRVLRLARFAVALPGFTAVPETLAAARAASGDLMTVSSERIRDELGRIFGHERATVGLELLLALTVFPGIALWPLGRGQPGKPAAAGSALALWRAFDLERARLAALAGDLFGSLELEAARWALAAEGLERLAAPLAVPGALASAGLVKRGVAEAAAALLAALEPPASALEMRRFLHHHAARWVTAVAVLGARARVSGEVLGEEPLKRLITLAREHGPELMHPPRLLTGGEVGEWLGLPPGPAIGEALERVLAAQVEGRVRTKEEALRLLRPSESGAVE